MSIELNIASAEQQYYNGTATKVSVPGVSGGFEIYPGHCPILALLTTGVVAAEIPGSDPMVLYIESGLVEVSGNKVSILADSAFLARELAEETLLQSQKEFRLKLAEKKDLNYTLLLKQIAETNAQLLAIKRLRRHKKPR